MAALRFCEICKEILDAERAENDRQTRLCTRHAREAARFGGEFRLHIRQERTSKQGSLKHNYGSVSVRFVPNRDGIEDLRDEYLASQA